MATKRTCTYYSNCTQDTTNSSYKYCDYAQYTCCGCSSPIDSGSLVVAGRNRFSIGSPSIECFTGTC
ncbi:hypothetical protein SAMN06295960_3587 [Paenibacillus aquistagni]|uniref:Uncharacterized protein n=1 Tax=Paenibacillus aquistagni TaxID=1852522 RepID=A0A1X7LJK2_9BACL|nr:hypothetical protein SAMN06295960_3587 [Paenibacillus aquistagni]